MPLNIEAAPMPWPWRTEKSRWHTREIGRVSISRPRATLRYRLAGSVVPILRTISGVADVININSRLVKDANPIRFAHQEDTQYTSVVHDWANSNKK